MAEILEDLESEDTNREIDRCGFQASQFEIFTHEYREKANPECTGNLFISLGVSHSVLASEQHKPELESLQHQYILFEKCFKND